MLPVEGQVEEYEGVMVVKIEISRPAISDALAQLSCLRYDVVERLRIEISGQGVELRKSDVLSPADRARIDKNGPGLSIELSETELEAWLAFLAACYWHKYAPVDHVDLEVVDEAGKEFMIVLAVKTEVDLKTPDEARRVLGLE